MLSINNETSLILSSFKSFLLTDDLDEYSTHLLVNFVADIIEREYTDLNILMHCAMSIGHFRVLLEKQLDEGENINISADFSLAYISFKNYLSTLSERQSRTTLTVILENQSLTPVLA